MYLNYNSLYLSAIKEKISSFPLDKTSGSVCDDIESSHPVRFPGKALLARMIEQKKIYGIGFCCGFAFLQLSVLYDTGIYSKTLLLWKAKSVPPYTLKFYQTTSLQWSITIFCHLCQHPVEYYVFFFKLYMFA